MRKLAVFIITFFLLISSIQASEYTTRVKIMNDKLPLRNDAGGTDGSKIDDLDLYDYYELTSDKLYDDINNHKRCNGGWYNITYYTGVTGFVCEDDVELVRSYRTDDVAPTTDCEIALNNAGFPSSYWGGLCKLKESHPTWNFQAISTDLNWSDVVSKESDCGRNYIHNSILDKSFLDPTCISTSPGGYVAPSQKATAYYMDPRNFLSEKYLFQFLDQNYVAEMESEYENMITSLITGTSFYNYHVSLNNNLPNIIYLASKEVGANPISMATRMRQELGGSDSLINLYSGVYPGYEGLYNFFNFGVTDSCVASSGTTVCGLEYAKKLNWEGLDVAIKGGISQIANYYIKQGQYTNYLQKFNVIPTNVNIRYEHQYMTNISAPMNESKLTYKAYQQQGFLDKNLLFRIPVYKNMSETINNSGSGAVEEPVEPPKPSSIPINTIVTSSGFKYSSKYISGIAVGTDVSHIASSLESVGGNATVKITNANNEEIRSGVASTGYKVIINNQTTTETLEIVINGDTSGDGVINALDLLQIQKNILGTYNLNGPYFEAGDTSKDGVINALDLLQVQKNILGTFEIAQ